MILGDIILLDRLCAIDVIERVQRQVTVTVAG